jgi:hypothetical protein
MFKNPRIDAAVLCDDVVHLDLSSGLDYLPLQFLEVACIDDAPSQ